MKSSRKALIEIAARKERLSARAQAQRLVIVGHVHSLRQPAAMIDRAVGIARFLRAHPLLVTVGVAALSVFRGRGIAGVATRAFSAWRLWRAVSAWAAGRV